MCVWNDARDEKCLTPGESDVPEREWVERSEDWQTSPWLYPIISIVIGYSPNHPMYLSCVTLTLKIMPMIDIFAHNFCRCYIPSQLKSFHYQSANLFQCFFIFFNNFINYKLHSAQCVPIHSSKKHPIVYLVMSLLYSSFWKVKCTLVAERENGFLLGPGLKVCRVHSTPLMGATLCYFVLFHFIVDLCAWLMRGHLYASMNVSVSSDRVIFLYNCLTGILNEYQYTSIIWKVFSSYLCFYLWF